jgi:hypothetical protein
VAERALTRRELNRALLARQLLLRRARLGVPRAIERIGALQAQWPPSPYVALWTRLDGFRSELLMRAIEGRKVVKASLMRVTLHHVSSRDYLAFAGEILGHRISSLERQLAKEPGEEDLDAFAAELVRLTTQKPRGRPELLRLLGRPKLSIEERRPWTVWHALTAKAGLLHAPPASRWRLSTAGVTFVPASVWLGADGARGDEAAAHLCGRYLAAFGPATRADAAQWTGLPVGLLERGLARLALRRFRDEQGRELLDLPRAPLPDAGSDAPPRFLPQWDSSLLAHHDRSRILPEEHRAAVINRGDIRSTFLVDGFVAGTWRVVDGRVELEPFAPLPARARRPLEEERRALERFLAATASSSGPRRAAPARPGPSRS